MEVDGTSPTPVDLGNSLPDELNELVDELADQYGFNLEIGGKTDAREKDDNSVADVLFLKMDERAVFQIE